MVDCNYQLYYHIDASQVWEVWIDHFEQIPVYRKPTHTNQYLQWDSHCAISAEYIVISTLFHRAKEVCSTKQHLEEEHEHLKKSPYIM